MPHMTSTEITKFLQAPRNAVVGTNRRDGPPQLSPVWYLYEEGRFYIGITKGTAKYHNLQRDPRISLCVDGGHGDSRAVMITGTVTMTPKGDPLQQRMRSRIIHHYIADENAARAYEEMSQDWESILLVVTPEKIISQNFNE